MAATCVTQPLWWRQSHGISITGRLCACSCVCARVCAVLKSAIVTYCLNPQAFAVNTMAQHHSTHQWKAPRVHPPPAAIHNHLAHSYFGGFIETSSTNQTIFLIVIPVGGDINSSHRVQYPEDIFHIFVIKRQVNISLHPKWCADRSCVMCQAHPLHYNTESKRFNSSLRSTCGIKINNNNLLSQHLLFKEFKSYTWNMRGLGLITGTS